MPHALNSQEPRPITGRFVLLCLLAFFGIVIAVNVVMARYAVATFGGVETASSYKAGLAFRSEEEAAGKQAGRHWNVDARLSDLGGGGRVIDVSAADAGGKPIAGLSAMVRLAHPTDARHDVKVELVDLGGGRYRATLDATPGQWDLVVDLSQGDERLFRSKNRVVLR